MLVLILGIVLTIVVYVVLGFRFTEETVTDAKGNVRTRRGTSKEWHSRPAQLLALAVLAAFILLSCITVVPTGYI